MTTTKRDEQTRDLAILAVEKLAMIPFIDRWNVGEPDFSLISGWDGFRSATALDRRLDDGVCEFADLADQRGLPNFMAAVRMIVEPTIASTFQRAMMRKAEDWAADLAAAPADAAVAPFESIDVWIQWCLASVEPPAFCGPQAEDIAAPEMLAVLLALALKARSAIAAGNGWIVNGHASEEPSPAVAIVH